MNATPDNGAVYFVISLLIYVLPTIIAWRRKHASFYAIAFTNIFLGWTFIGWVWALIWALGNSNRPQQITIVNNVSNGNNYDR